MCIFISPEISYLAFHLRQQGDKTSGLTVACKSKTVRKGLAYSLDQLPWSCL
jgi:hypothetical protein